MINLISKYFPDLSDNQISQFEQLDGLYAEWNEKINVISRKDIDQLYERHVLHSLAFNKFQSFNANQSVLDVGTGGGFPGVPLAILNPEVQFHLVDSIGKKLKVIEAVAEAINLTNLTTEHTRMEKVKGKYDFIVSRAVAPAIKICSWTHQLLKNDGHSMWLLLKGGDLTDELNELKRPHALHNLTEVFEESFFETKKLVCISR